MIRRDVDVTEVVGKNCRLEYYDCVSAVMNYPDRLVKKENLEHFEESVTEHHSSKSWYGIDGNGTEVMESVRLGWKEGVEEGKKFAKEYKIPSLNLPSERRKKVWGMQGMQLDPVRASQGRLDPWRKMKKTQASRFAKKGMATIAIRVDGNAGVSADELFWRGLTGLTIAESLMKSGRRVRILAIIATSGRDTHGNMIAAIQVKGYAEAVDRARLFSHVCLSGFFRTIGFKAILNSKDRVGHGLGSTWSINEDKLADALDPLADDSPMIIVDGATSESSAKKALDKIQTLINEAR